LDGEIPNSTVHYCTVMYSTVQYSTVLYCTVLYCTVLYCTALYCTVLYCTVLYCTALYGTVLYCTVQHCTVFVLYCTVLHGSSPPDYRRLESLSLKGLGRIVAPLLYSSVGSTPSISGLIRNCWRIPAKKRKSSALARVSPRH